MKSKTFTMKGKDGAKIFVYSWLPDSKPVAAVQISHGMAEHAARYERFAGALTEAGFAVYAPDQRGHGRTAGSLEAVGWIAEKDGWDLAVDDLHRLTEHIKNEHPGVPVFLFGHSMGSFLSRNYIARWGNEVKGAVFSGTGGNPGLLGKVGILVARLEKKLKGGKARSPLLTSMSFGAFNKPFKPNRTDFDWLSRDNAEVDKYVADPYCGGVFSGGFWVDFLKGLDSLYRPGYLDKIPRNLPIFLFSGEKDPVGNNGKGVTEVYDSYRKAGIKDVSMKLYPDGRHEMLNETNRKEVFKDVIGWLKKHL
jgi:alpha-beta hydrolase superfamily lysophospholipase